MKRLNFGQVEAEKSSMQRADPFFTMILFIFSTLVVSYFAFDFHLSGIDVERHKVISLSAQLQAVTIMNEALKLKTENLTNAKNSMGGRQIASLRQNKSSSLQKEISFDALYESQLNSAVKNRQAADILEVSKKILDSSVDDELLAQALFAKANLNCEIVFKEEACFADVETIVMQFPESRWAGKSLVQLSQLYFKQKKYREAESVIKIVKAEFFKEKDLMKQINQLEKLKL